MDFEEKMDALRMNLELASHDIESLRGSIRELRDASASQHENIQALMKTSSNLLATAESHERRIQGLERRA
jgi:chromosome segregation ATPase